MDKPMAPAGAAGAAPLSWSELIQSEQRAHRSVGDVRWRRPAAPWRQPARHCLAA